MWVLTGTHFVWHLHPGRMIEVLERQLLRAWFAWLCKCLLSHVCGGGRFTVNLACLPAPPPLLVERVSGDLADSTRQSVRDAAPSSLPSSRNCRVTCVWICSPWHLVAPRLLVQAETPLVAVMVDAIEYGFDLVCVSSLMDSSVRVCIAIPHSVLAGKHRSETVVLITLRATLSGSCPDSKASNAVHSDSQLL